MKGILIPTDGMPREVEIEQDSEGLTLHSLQALVGGIITPFDVIFDNDISLYVNDEGLFTCPPNRAVYSTKSMEETGYLSQLDYAHPVQEDELYTVLHGNIVALGFDWDKGTSRSLSADEMAQVNDYFSNISKPGSGAYAELAIKAGMSRPTRERVESFTRGVKFYESTPDAPGEGKNGQHDLESVAKGAKSEAEKESAEVDFSNSIANPYAGKVER